MAEVYVKLQKDLGFGIQYILSDGTKISGRNNLPAGIAFGAPGTTPIDPIAKANPPIIATPQPGQSSADPAPPIEPAVKTSSSESATQVRNADTISDTVPTNPNVIKITDLDNDQQQAVNRAASGRSPLDNNPNELDDQPAQVDPLVDPGLQNISSTNVGPVNIQTNDDSGITAEQRAAGLAGVGTDQISGAERIALGRPAIVTQTNAAVPIPTEKNKLDPFVNYTYNIDLFALDLAGYNTIIEGGTDGIEHVLKHLLISSGGKQQGRSHLFLDDFYIDDLEIDTIGPTTQQTRNTHSINIKFKIIEPYGISLIERLIDVASTLLKIDSNRYTEIPYMLRISFVGYDELGVPMKVPNTTKYLLIKIWQMKFEVNEGGATYMVQSQPFSHQAFKADIDRTLFDFEIPANSVGGFFKNNGTVIPTTTEERAGGGGRTVTIPGDPIAVSFVDLLNKRERIVSKEGNDANHGTPITGTTSASDTVLTETHQKEFRDRYSIELDPEMAAAKLEYYTFDPNNTISAKDKKDPKNFYRNFVQNVGKKFKLINKSGTAIRITAGTSLVEIMGMMLIHSTYLHSQYKGPLSDKKTIPLKWFKITPIVKIRDQAYSESLGRYAYDITYLISKYVVDNIKIESSKKSIPRGNRKGHHKEYNYMYTGENTDILNFDIKYDLAYQTISTVTVDKGSDRVGTRGISDKGNTSVQTQISNSGIKQTLGIPSKGSNGNAGTSYDVLNNVLTSGVDLFNLNMEIIGDPDYIMQNDVYGNEHLRRASLNTPYLKNGSINYDQGEIYVKVNFKTPVDYDPLSGLMDLTSGTTYQKSTHFGGVYQVWKVKHSFSGGQFTQTLNGIRLIEDDDNKSSSDNTKERKEEGFGRGLINKISITKSPPIDEATTPPINRDVETVPLPDLLPSQFNPDGST